MDGESAGAFNAFCLYRAMGYSRSIKSCMELHGIEAKKYGSWARWARLFDWKNRAALYDEFIAKETEKGLINEHVEHRKRFMAMIGRMIMTAKTMSMMLSLSVFVAATMPPMTV